jgi:hypothetical protein
VKSHLRLKQKVHIDVELVTRKRARNSNVRVSQNTNNGSDSNWLRHTDDSRETVYLLPEMAEKTDIRSKVNMKA